MAMKREFTFFFIIFLYANLSLSSSVKDRVFVMKIERSIDVRMSRHVYLALEKAIESQADYIIIELNTYGGTVIEADKIRTSFLDSKIPTFAFINKNAASAGALIAISCDSIYMNEGASIGAATVVHGSDGSKAPDKYQSYFRSTMRSTAQANGRDPKIAEAMVDENLAIEGVIPKGQVLTFTVMEALRHGFCEAKVSSIEEILTLNGIDTYELILYQTSITESIISWFLNPAISSILILIIIAGIYFELQTPGIGFPILAAGIAALLYFLPYYFSGLAANWEIVIFILGVLLIGIELFILPGFGVSGITGIMLVLSSFTLVMIDNDWFDFSNVQIPDLSKALLVSIGGVIGAISLIFIIISKFSSLKYFNHVTLESTLSAEEGYISHKPQKNLSKRDGIAYTVLRPSGKVQIDNIIYDATTRGEYIERGEKIIVSSCEKNTITVKKLI